MDNRFVMDESSIGFALANLNETTGPADRMETEPKVRMDMLKQRETWRARGIENVVTIEEVVMDDKDNYLIVSAPRNSGVLVSTGVALPIGRGISYEYITSLMRFLGYQIVNCTADTVE